MKFYSDIKGNESVYCKGRVYRFENGVLDVSEKEIQEELKKSYRYEAPKKAKEGEGIVNNKHKQSKNNIANK